MSIDDYNRLYDKAYSHKEMGDVNGLIKALENLLRIYPKRNAHYISIAIEYLESEEYDNCIKFAEKYLFEIPDKDKETTKEKIISFTYHSLGISYANKMDYKNAIKNYQKSIDLDNYIFSYVHIGQCYDLLGMKQESISFWQSAAKRGSSEAILALNSRGIDIKY